MTNSNNLKQRVQELEKCFNTLAHGCIWGEEVSGWAEIDELAQKDGFTKSNITYVGNINTYDTHKTYAFFRNDTENRNYLMEFVPKPQFELLEKKVAELERQLQQPKEIIAQINELQKRNPVKIQI